MRGAVVRRVVCGRRCAYWVPKRPIDRFICASLLLALLCLTGAVLSMLSGQLALQDSVNTWVVLDSPHAHSFDRWSSVGASSPSSSPSSSLGVYVFDVTNPDEVLTDGAPAALVEKGPLVYRRRLNRFDVAFSDDGSEVEFSSQQWFHWDAAATTPGLDPATATATNADLAALLLFEKMPDAAGELSDEVVTLLQTLDQQLCATPQKYPKLCNGTLAQVESWLEADDIIWKTLFKRLLCADGHGSTPFVEVTLHEMVWGGESSVLANLKTVLRGLQGVLQTLDDQVDDGTSGQALAHALATVDGLVDALITTSLPLRRNASTPYEAAYYGSPDTLRTGTGARRHGRAQVGKFVRRQSSKGFFRCAASLTTDEAPPTLNGSTRMCPPFDDTWSEAHAAEQGWRLLWDGAKDVTDSSNGDQFKPAHWFFGSAHESLSMVDDLLGRPVPLRLTGQSGGTAPLHTKRYEIPDSVLASASSDPENVVFDQLGPTGLANLSRGWGLPLFGSRPHFLGGDAVLTASVQGLRPDQALHATFVDVEPLSGVAANRAVRWQVNTLVTDWALPTIGETEDDALLLLEEALWYFACVKSNTTSAEVEALCAFLAERDQALTTCLAEPGHWTLQGQDEPWAGLFLPWAWTEDTTTLSAHDTSQLNDDTTDAPHRAKVARNVFVVLTAAFSMLFVVGILARLSIRDFTAGRYSATGKLLAVVDELDDSASVSSHEQAWLVGNADDGSRLLRSSSVHRSVSGESQQSPLTEPWIQPADVADAEEET